MRTTQTRAGHPHVRCLQRASLGAGRRLVHLPGRRRSRPPSRSNSHRPQCPSSVVASDCDRLFRHGESSRFSTKLTDPHDISRHYWNMTPQQLEAIVLQAIDRARSGTPVEDDRIELKRKWPDPLTKARQLAGAANKANGDYVIYIIGVDEKTGQIVDHSEFDSADWWAQTSSQFDEVPPDLNRHFAVSVAPGEAVTALLFTTDRAPYLVKVTGGNSERDLPFRDGTRTRSMKRSELLRLLIPQSTVPPALILGARASATWYAAIDDRRESFGISGVATVFLEHTASSSIFIPIHNASASLTSEGLRFDPGLMLVTYPQETPPSFGVHNRSDGVVASGPGRFSIRFNVSLDAQDREAIRSIEHWRLTLKLPVAGSSRPIELVCEMSKRPSSFTYVSEIQEQVGNWGYGKSDS